MTTLQQHPDSGFELRAAGPEDADAIRTLFDAASLAATGFHHRETERVHAFLARMQQTYPGAAAQVAAASGGRDRLMGAALLSPPKGRTLALVAVHPDQHGHGTGGALADWLAAHALQVADGCRGEAVTLVQRVLTSNRTAGTLLEARGWQRSHSMQRMERALTHSDASASPGTGSGFEIRPVVPEREMEALLLAEYLAFQESESYDLADCARALARRRQWLSHDGRYDPGVWFVAIVDAAYAAAAYADAACADAAHAAAARAAAGSADGDPTIAGLCLCTLDTVERADMAWINRLAVRTPWRGRGIGQALLGTAFAELTRRGKRHVGLNVVAGNEPAVRVYRQAGMAEVLSMQLDEYELPVGRGPGSAAKAEPHVP
jgi:GNAT superfamily N-acetyltransferase